MKIRFGTDGWRGVMARDFTFDNVRQVTAAVAGYLEDQGTADRGVAVGFDRRLLSREFAAEAAGVLAARGIPVCLAAGPEPTPLLSWAVHHQGLAGGIAVTASHNPPEWNGLKFKEPFGGSAGAEACRAVEAHLADLPEGGRIPCLSATEARRRGLLEPLDAWQGYPEALGRLVDFDCLRSAGLRVAVDAMHGCGTPGLRTLLEEAGCRVIELRPEWNPGFGGASPEPVEANLIGLAETVRAQGCELGLANDGDGDRIGAVDERSRYFSPQRILAVLLRYLREIKGLGGDVIKAVSATSLVDLLAARYGLGVRVTPIGFKHIGEAMRSQTVLIGGEESGGIGIPAHLPERDGLLNALLLAEIVARTGKGLRAYAQEIFDQVGYFTYARLDLPLDPSRTESLRDRIAGLEDPGTLAGRPVREVLRLDGTRFLRDDASWLLVRPSGTEPLLRLYAEARSGPEVGELLAEGRRLAGV
jgi:phosphomannomutase